MNKKSLKKIFKPPAELWPFKFLLLATGLVVYSLLRLLRPLVKVRVGCLRYDRIGHLAPNTELYLRRRFQKKPEDRELDLFVSGQPANQQLFRIIKRRVRVIKNKAFLWTYEAVRSLIGNSSLWIDLPALRGNFSQDFDKIPPQLSFTAQEQVKGEKLLRSLGIESTGLFVCLHTRDSAYLKKMHQRSSKGDWSYHDYRDCDVNNYLPAVNYLTSLGIFVIRMGYIVEKKLVSDNPFIIDYATDHRSDFGDIYISSKCKFFIGSEGGLITVPWVFNVPVAYSNGVPVGGIAGWRSPDVYIPKKLWSKESKRLLTFKEIIAAGADKWYQTQQYKEAGIEIVENTPDEILGLVKEINARLDGKWVIKEEDEALQRRYRSLFPSDSRCSNFPSRIGAEFLRFNRELLG